VTSVNALVVLTHACNLDCVHCYDRSRRGARPGVELLPRVESMLGGFGDARPYVVLISGGEPLTDPRWRQVVQSVKAHGYGVELFTNGFRGQQVVGAGVERVHTSLDGPPLVHNSLRRSSTAFAGFESLMGALRGSGTPCSVQVTVSRLNVAHLGETLDLLGGYEVVSEVSVEPMLVHSAALGGLGFDLEALRADRFLPQIVSFMERAHYRRRVRWNVVEGRELLSRDPASLASELPVFFDLSMNDWAVLGLKALRHNGLESFGGALLACDRAKVTGVLERAARVVAPGKLYSLEQIVWDGFCSPDWGSAVSRVGAPL